MVKVGEAKKTKNNETSGKFINFTEIGKICNMHHWFRPLGAMDAPG